MEGGVTKPTLNTNLTGLLILTHRNLAIGTGMFKYTLMYKQYETEE